MMRALIRTLVPKRVKEALRQTYVYTADGVDSLLGRHKDDLVPPRRLTFVGRQQNFKRAGLEFLELFRERGGLQPTHDVLDIGCGIGRMAIPLTTYLSSSSHYEGFDIVPHGIEWCQAKVTRRFPNFRFTLAAVRNPLYSPNSGVEACDFVFPYADASFDFAFATSVFTHMRPQEVERYFREIGRVLRPSGICFVTCFVLNEYSEAAISAHKANRSFAFTGDGYRYFDRDSHEMAIAYTEDAIRTFHGNAGLTPIEPFETGSWTGKTDALTAQDIVVSRKACR